MPKGVYRRATTRGQYRGINRFPSPVPVHLESLQTWCRPGLKLKLWTAYPGCPTEAFVKADGDDEMANADLALWRAVIVQAMDDASSADRSARAVLEKNRARRWLIGRSDDFKRVCDLADLRWKAVADVMDRNATAGWPRVALPRSLNNDRLDQVAA